MLFLHSNGVGTSRAVRIYKTYGADAIQLISENSYRSDMDPASVERITQTFVAIDAQDPAGKAVLGARRAMPLCRASPPVGKRSKKRPNKPAFFN
jgi:hypothetical protein